MLNSSILALSIRLTLFAHTRIRVGQHKAGRPHSFSGIKRRVGTCKMLISCRRLPLSFADTVSCEGSSDTCDPSSPIFGGSLVVPSLSFYKSS
ncbi:hypothetical protein AVEN_227891-1 [Araneus ventricosus]|uniref:Secreted protein n=1 Tax=Araneus ventricosus TaxID=182803 RepID=A0A4Y2MAT3_ARAVE|nr:hypothetical protein AVEN_227891-1 [Araneus ventricosus]